MFYKIVDGEDVFFTGNVLNTKNGTVINPTDEQMLVEGWLVYQEPEPTQEELLAQAKTDKLMQIDMYDNSTNVNLFTINDVPMWLDHNLRQQIRTSVEAYTALGAETMTKVFNGAEFTFPLVNWLQMLNALEVYAAEALNTTERHKNAVNALTTVQAVIDYDYTTGYPLKLAF